MLIQVAPGQLEEKLTQDVFKWLTTLASTSYTGWSAKDLVREIALGKMQLWLPREPVTGVVLTELRQQPSGLELVLWGIAGKGILLRFDQAYQVLQLFAQSEGCKWITTSTIWPTIAKTIRRKIKSPLIEMTHLTTEVPQMAKSKTGIGVWVRVQTPEGDKPVGDLLVGDKVKGPSGWNKVSAFRLVLLEAVSEIGLGINQRFIGKDGDWTTPKREQEPMAKTNRIGVEITVEPDHTFYLTNGLHVHNTGGGGGAQNVTQKTEPWDEAKPYYERLYSEAENAFNQVDREAYTGQRVAPPTQLQKNSLQQTLAQRPQLAQSGGQIRNLGTDTLAGGYLSPNTNPFLRQAADAASRQTVNQFQKQIVPSIASQAQMQGAYGGDRHGIALGTAAEGTAQAISDSNAKIFADNYANERRNQLIAPSLVQQGLTMEMMPSQLTGQVGATERGWQQQELEAAMAAFNEAQMAPYKGVGEWAHILNGGGFSTKPTQASGGGSSPLLGALGGGLMGMQAAPMLGGMLAGGSSAAGPSAMLASGMANPLMLPLIAGGALLGGLL